MASNEDAGENSTLDNHDPDADFPTALSGDRSEGMDPHSLGQDEVKEQADTVGWDGPGDPADPRNWGPGKKMSILAVIALMALITYVAIPPRVNT